MSDHDSYSDFRHDLFHNRENVSHAKTCRCVFRALDPASLRLSLPLIAGVMVAVKYVKTIGNCAERKIVGVGRYDFGGGP
jgi:hypothetical protein